MICKCFSGWLALFLPWALVATVHAWEPLQSVEQWQAQRPAAALTYVDFWASWCGPCQQSFPVMQQWQQRYAEQGLKILTISLDGRAADAQRFLQRVDTELSVQWDPDAILAQHFAVQTMPQSYLLDAQGQVLATHRGFQHKDIPKIEALIETHLEQSRLVPGAQNGD